MPTLKALIALALLFALTNADGRECDCEDDVMDCEDRRKTALREGEICRGAKNVLLSSNMFRTFPGGLSLINFINVNVSHNELTSLPVASKLSRRLRVFDLSSNDISATTNEFRMLATLDVLRVSKNFITSIAFLPDPCNLRTFEATGNWISSLEGPLRKCIILHTLNIANNRLTALSDDEFLGLVRLKSLDLSYNPLRHMTSSTFEGLSQLETLLLNNCELTSLPARVFYGLVSIKILNLSSNMIVSLPGTVFERLTSLQQLQIASNQLLSIDPPLFAVLKELSFLSLNFNNITSIAARTFNDLPRLQILQVNGNLISNVSPQAFSNLPSFRILLLDANRLTSLPDVVNCSAFLEELSLDHNNVSQPSEAMLKRYLSKPSLQVSLKYNPVLPRALQWMAADNGLNFHVDSDDCACGVVQRLSAVIELCADIDCGGDRRHNDWVAALRAAAG